jgi:hypothetical protein
MMIRDLFRVRLLAGCAPVLTLALVGCSQQQPQQQSAESAHVPPTVVLAPPGATGAIALSDPNPLPGAARAQPEPAQPEPSAPTFAFPPDLTGKALARMVAPDGAHALAAEHTRATPKPRTVPRKVMDPDPLPRAHAELPPLLPARPGPLKPVPPEETVPVNFGTGAGDGPTKPVMPVAPVVTERARDVNLSPPAPVLGRPAPDRVSLDDPTSELGNAEVVAGLVKVPLAPSPFLKVDVPDPFELAEQVKPRVPPSSEPSAIPVPVNPQRVK